MPESILSRNQVLVSTNIKNQVIKLENEDTVIQIKTISIIFWQINKKINLITLLFNS